MIDQELSQRLRWLTAEQDNILQRSLMNDYSFANYVRDLLYISLIDKNFLGNMWRKGLIRCDMLVSRKRIRRNGIYKTKNWKDVYVDQRPIPRRKTGWGSSITWRTGVSDETPYFHAYRIFVIHHIFRSIQTGTSETQFLLWKPGLVSTAKRAGNRLAKSTATSDYQRRLEKWNSITELCIALEPYSSQFIHNTITAQIPLKPEEMHEHFEKRLDDMRHILDALGLDFLEDLRTEIVRDAEVIEPNRRLHVIARLMDSSERKKLKRDIGTACLFWEMAEVIRRAAEAHFKVSLPEEDQVGYATWFKDGRMSTYGTERVLDGGITVARTFLNNFNLDAAVRIRCYVEGDTEAAVLHYLLDGYGQYEIVDLRGHVAAKAGRGVAFRDSLLSDKIQQVFSFIFIDGDRSDFVRAVKKAAENDEIVGAFYISTPDFEFQNFTAHELWQIICELSDNPIDPENSPTEDQLNTCESASDFFKLVHSVTEVFIDIDKGLQWGKQLIRYAQKNPIKVGTNSERPILSAMKILYGASRYHYQLSLENRVDPDTGQSVKREL